MEKAKVSPPAKKKPKEGNDSHMQDYCLANAGSRSDMNWQRLGSRIELQAPRMPSAQEPTELEHEAAVAVASDLMSSWEQ